MTQSDEKYYQRRAIEDQKRSNALDKARKRGEASAKWFNEGNKLTPQTLPEFNALMKQIDEQSE